MNAQFRQDRVEIVAKVTFSLNPAASTTAGWTRVKLRLPGTMKRLNVEHRTSNIERRILMALRFIESKTSKSQNLEGWFCFAQPFFKLTEYIIGCWTFNVDELVKIQKFDS